MYYIFFFDQIIQHLLLFILCKASRALHASITNDRDSKQIEAIQNEWLKSILQVHVLVVSAEAIKIETRIQSTHKTPAHYHTQARVLCFVCTSSANTVCLRCCWWWWWEIICWAIHISIMNVCAKFIRCVRECLSIYLCVCWAFYR